MQAIEQVTAEPALHTRDLGGSATTAQVTEAVCARLAASTRSAAPPERNTTFPESTGDTHDLFLEPSPPRRSQACAFAFCASPAGARAGPGLADQADDAWSCRSRPAAPPTCWRARSADKLSQSLGQPVIVESKPGAGATLGADYVAKAKPDGYTLLVGAVHHTIATSVYKKLPYDFQKDFAPVTTVALVPERAGGQCRQHAGEDGRRAGGAGQGRSRAS